MIRRILSRAMSAFSRSRTGGHRRRRSSSSEAQLAKSAARTARKHL